MDEFPMMVPISQAEFWDKMLLLLEKVVEARMTLREMQKAKVL